MFVILNLQLTPGQWTQKLHSYRSELSTLCTSYYFLYVVDCVWNVMAHMQKPDFGRNIQVHLNQQGHQFSLLLAAKVWASAVVMLDTPCSEVVWRVLATHSIRQFPPHFPSRASPCAITFQLDSTNDHLDDNPLYDSYQFPILSRRLLAEVNKFICMLFMFKL